MGIYLGNLIHEALKNNLAFADQLKAKPSDIRPPDTIQGIMAGRLDSELRIL